MCQYTGHILPPSFHTPIPREGHTWISISNSNSNSNATQMASISTCFTITPTTSRLLTFTSSPFPKPLFSPFQQNRTTNKRRAWAFVPRAAVDLGRAIRPGGIVESDKLPSDVRKRTMDAVDACGGRVTIGDVASKAGLKLNQAQKALQALAADTNGFLEVPISFPFFILFIFSLGLFLNFQCRNVIWIWLSIWNKIRQLLE